MNTFHDFPHLVPTLHHVVDRRATAAWHVPRGRRGFHNLMLIVAGKGIVWSGGEDIRLAPGMMIYHSVHQDFGYETSRESLIHCLGTNFSLAAVTPDEGEHWRAIDIPALPLETVTRPDNFERMVKISTDMAQTWSLRKDHYMLRCRSLFLNLLEELARSSESSGLEDKVADRIRRVVSYMEANLQRRISLVELAEIAGLTPSYFGQLFHQRMGATPVEYMNALRVDKAQYWMENGCTLSEAAARSGFQDPFYFSRVYKRIKGTSPSEHMRRTTFF